MRTTALTFLTAVALSGAAVSPATAANTPGDAATITLGQTYFGDSRPPRYGLPTGSVWRMPVPLLPGDLVTVAGSYSGSNFLPVGFAGDVDNYDYYGDRWQDDSEAANADGVEYFESGAGSRLRLTLRRGCTTCYLELGANGFNTGYNGAYQFVVESIQHQMGLALDRVSSVKRRGWVRGNSRLTNNTAVPDGTRISLVVTGKGGQRWTYSTTTLKGQVRIKLRLPKKVIDKKVRLSLVKSEDASWRAASSPVAKVKVRR